MILPLVLAASAFGPGGHVNDVAVLPDGQVLVARSDGLLHVVDPDSGTTTRRVPPEHLAVFAQHAASVEYVEVDPRGELVAASSEDGRVALWEASVEREGSPLAYPGRYGRPRAILRPTPETWTGAARIEWTHDGRLVLTWTCEGPRGGSPTAVQLWTREGDLVWTGFHARWADASPANDWIAAVREDEVVLVRPGESATTFHLDGALAAVAFSPDGKRLAVGGTDRRLWILDVETGDVLLEKSLDSDPFDSDLSTDSVTRARWSPTGKWVGVALGKTLRAAVLDAETGDDIWWGAFHGSPAWRGFELSWTPDDRIVVGFLATYCVDPESRELARLFRGRHTSIEPIDGGRAIVCAVRGWAVRFDLETNRRVWRREECH